MKYKSISVIIPVHNDKENLKKCLVSLFDAEFKNFEVIIVDDCSDDALKPDTEGFPCKVIPLSANSGPAYARNAGVAESTGEIVLFTDADCIVMKDWVLKAAEELIRSHEESPDIAAVCGRLKSGEGFFEMCDSYSGYGYVQNGSRRSVDYLNTACLAFFKEAFCKVGGLSEDMRISEDMEFAIKLVESGYKVIFEPSIYVFHNHGIAIFKDFMAKHKNWGKGLGLNLALKHRNRSRLLLPLLLNPVTHFLMILPIALLTTIKIVCFNIKYDKRMLAYAPFIFLSKIYFRWGIFIRYIAGRGEKDDKGWKKLDRQFHEDDSIVESYDRKFRKKYYIDERYFTIDPWVEELKKADKKLVLDIGCGTGPATIKLLKNGIQVISLDTSLNMLRNLQKKAKADGLDAMCVRGDAENLPFKDEIFDGVISKGLLHHLPNIKTAVEDQIRVLKRGGLLFMAEPFKHIPWFSYFYHVPLDIIKFIVRGIAGNRLKTMEKPLTRLDLESISDLLDKNNFEYRIKYLVYWPLVFAYLPERIAYRAACLLNKINLNAKAGDGVIITGRKR